MSKFIIITVGCLIGLVVISIIIGLMVLSIWGIVLTWQSDWALWLKILVTVLLALLLPTGLIFNNKSK